MSPDFKDYYRDFLKDDLLLKLSNNAKKVISNIYIIPNLNFYTKYNGEGSYFYLYYKYGLFK